MALNPMKKEVLKYGILDDLLFQKEPDLPRLIDRIGIGVAFDDFAKLLLEMQAEGLIFGVVFTRNNNNEDLLPSFHYAEISEAGKKYLENILIA